MIINPTEKEDHIPDINVDDLFSEEEVQIELEGFNTNRQEQTRKRHAVTYYFNGPFKGYPNISKRM